MRAEAPAFQRHFSPLAWICQYKDPPRCRSTRISTPRIAFLARRNILPAPGRPASARQGHRLLAGDCHLRDDSHLPVMPDDWFRVMFYPPGVLQDAALNPSYDYCLIVILFTRLSRLSMAGKNEPGVCAASASFTSLA